MSSQFVNLPGFGNFQWKAPVANAAALPTVNNLSGDVRVALDTGDLYEWNGSNWQLAGGGGGGGVSSVSVVTANGFAGTVANPTTTPAITISTSITGILKGNGTAVSAASAGTDYVIPSGSITGTASNITATSNSTLVTLSALSLPYSQITGAPGGTVTSVALADSTGLFNITGSPVTSSGTLTLSSFQSQAQHAFFAGPSGASGAPTFRAIVASDVPTLNQNTTGTAANITATSNSTLTTLSSLSLPYSQLSGTVPTWNQNTTGTAANITATSNSTLTTLSSLSLPFTQLSGQATLAQLPSIGSDTVLGNVTGGTAVPTALSQTQLTALVNSFTSSLSGAAPASGGGTTNFLRADGTWATPSGTGGITALTGDGSATGPGSAAFTLATVASGATTGSSTAIPVVTFNNKGLVTGISTAVVIAPAGTLSGTTLNSTVVSSSLTSVGTIATGVWNGTTIAQANGGTGFSTYTTGDILYASASNVLSKLGIGTSGQTLTVVSGVPAWATGAGTGTVTSVGLADSTGIFNISGSPVTSSGTLGLSSLIVQATNTVLAGPTGSNTTQTFNSGAGNYTVPAGYVVSQIELWGAGGGGGAALISLPGNGGGGGGYCKNVATVAAGTVIAYSVGSAGSAGSGNPGNGGTGGNTTCTTYSLTANGGVGGGGSGTGAAGTGGTASGGTTNTTGSNGTLAGPTNGGNGGASPSGGATATGGSGAGAAGNAPGGGGAGAGDGGGAATGGAGAAGRITFTLVAITSFRPLVAADIPALSYVTSVGLTDSTGLFTVTGSPVTSSGNLTLSAFASQSQNAFLAGPSSGGAGAAAFRAIAVADVPTLNQNTSGTAANITASSNTSLTSLANLVTVGTITTGAWHGTNIVVSFGGTGNTSATAYAPIAGGTTTTGAFQSLSSGMSNSGYVLTSNGSSAAPTWQAAAVSGITALTGDVTASGSGSVVATLAATTNSTLATLSGLTSASSLATVGTITSGTWNATSIAIAHGGTGQTTAAAAMSALSPITTTGDIIYSSSGTTNSRLGIGSTGQVLQVVSGAPAWVTPAAAAQNYASGYISTGTPGRYWSNAGSSYGTATINSGTALYTSRFASGITITLAASNGPGITFTPSSATAVYRISVSFPFQSVGQSVTSGIQLTNTTSSTVIAQGQNTSTGWNNTAGQIIGCTIEGIVAPASTAAQTFQIQAYDSGSNGFIIGNGQVSGGTSFEWTVVQIAP